MSNDFPSKYDNLYFFDLSYTEYKKGLLTKRIPKKDIPKKNDYRKPLGDNKGTTSFVYYFVIKELRF
jgi:hypothetical protein